MSKIFICSDTHFGHSKEFLYGPRGFNNVKDHDATIIENWNKVVEPDDTVYILGDIMLNDNDNGIECLRQLNGKIKIIPGNHDTSNRLDLYNQIEDVKVLPMAIMLKYKKYSLYLSHYPTITSNHDYEKPLFARVINICGHCHTNDKFSDFDKGLIYHVEMDAHNNTPVLIDDIIEDIKKKLEEMK